MIYLVNQDPGHNKFYIIEQKNKTVYTTNGRLGTTGKKREKTFTSTWRADNFACDKKREKHNRGYSEAAKEEFKKLNLQAAIVGSANKCESIQWVDEKRMKHLSDSDLQDPNCKACILVDIETRKKYDGEQSFRLLFTPNETYLMDCGRQTIDESSELYKFVDKVGRAALLQEDEV